MTMRSFFYTIGAMLVVIWAIGFFFVTIGGLIHLLAVLAGIFFVCGLISRRPTVV